MERFPTASAVLLQQYFSPEKNDLRQFSVNVYGSTMALVIYVMANAIAATFAMTSLCLLNFSKYFLTSGEIACCACLFTIWLVGMSKPRRLPSHTVDASSNVDSNWMDAFQFCKDAGDPHRIPLSSTC